MSTTSSGAGTPGDFVNPFVSAVKAAGGAAVAESRGDPRIIAAVKLGWVMKGLTASLGPQPLPEGLVLGPAEGSQAQALQLSTLLGQLALPGLPAGAIDAAVTALSDGPDATASDALRSTVVVAVLGAGHRLAQAYALGEGLRALAIPGGDTPTARTTLVDELDALSSDLPSHAARGVGNSIASWSSDAPGAASIETQVVLWRAVIVGDKRGIELLSPDDYLLAARELEHKFLHRALTNRWLWAVTAVALALFVGGVIVLVSAGRATGQVAAGASAVLAAFGLTWKGIGGLLGKVVGKLEAPLWGAEVDTAIAHAVTLTRDAPPPLPSLGYDDRLSRATRGRRRGRGHAGKATPEAGPD